MVEDRVYLQWLTNWQSYMVYHGLSIFSDIEQSQTQISSLGHFLTLNISKMAKDTAIVTMEGE